MDDDKAARHKYRGPASKNERSIGRAEVGRRPRGPLGSVAQNPLSDKVGREGLRRHGSQALKYQHMYRPTLMPPGNARRALHLAVKTAILLVAVSCAQDADEVRHSRLTAIIRVVRAGFECFARLGGQRAHGAKNRQQAKHYQTASPGTVATADQ